jgi:hypothetical protein
MQAVNVDSLMNTGDRVDDDKCIWEVADYGRYDSVLFAFLECRDRLEVVVAILRNIKALQ